VTRTLPTQIREAMELRREVEAREAALYGPLLEDVKLLRRRGFGVHIECRGYRVGNRLMDAGQLAATAARERRLREPLPTPPPGDD
jgi:hypothetical protein